ncbi:hypothetical protein GQ53DRAFT_834304 [Thozetella sp. PMI_491]|nr:hypothetical protein GQ53DRAFT_834304 [Thozetella sp. PMI_491]
MSATTIRRVSATRAFDIGDEDAADDGDDAEIDEELEIRMMIVNADGLRYGDTEEVAGSTVRAALPLRELLGAASYEEMVITDPPSESWAFYIIPLCHTHPVQGELELNCHGRAHFEDECNQERPSVLPIKSFPIFTIIDGFGVFNNSYRTLIGFYFTPAGLGGRERASPGSIFPIVLGSHASNFDDVISALRSMAYLDVGAPVEINGDQVRLCALMMCYSGDMPQQAETRAGVRRASVGCVSASPVSMQSTPTHARWIIIVSAFLLAWLKKEHTQPGVCNSIAKETGRDAVEPIIETTAATAKSTCLLMSRDIPPEDRADMASIIYRARHLFNQLCICAAQSSVVASIAASAATAIRQMDADSYVGYDPEAEDLGFEAGREGKHYFKTRAYETNYSNVEKLTADTLVFYQKCPSLFHKVLSRADEDKLDVLMEDVEHEMSAHKSINQLDQAVTQEGRAIYLGNLNFRAKKADVEQLLRDRGFDNCTFYWPDLQGPGQNHTGWCLVQFGDKDTAECAMAKLSQALLAGRAMNTGPPKRTGPAKTTSANPSPPAAKAATVNPVTQAFVKSVYDFDNAYLAQRKADVELAKKLEETGWGPVGPTIKDTFVRRDVTGQPIGETRKQLEIGPDALQTESRSLSGLEAVRLSDYPLSWARDPKNPVAHLEPFFRRYEEELEGPYTDAAIKNRFLTGKKSMGEPKFLTRLYPSPGPLNDNDASVPQIVCVKASDGGMEMTPVPFDRLPEALSQGWVTFDHPERPIDIEDKDPRVVARIEDVLTTDAPYKDTPRYFKGVSALLGPSAGQGEWEAGRLLGKTSDEQGCISRVTSFVPPAESSANISTATSPGHVHKFWRPAKVGLGWGDYDRFYEWQSHGRQVKSTMPEKKEWSTDPQAPFTFVSESTGHEITVNNRLVTLGDTDETNDEERVAPLETLYDKLNRARQGAAAGFGPAIVVVDALRYGDLRDTASRTMLSAPDLNVLGAASYEEIVFAEQPTEPRPDPADLSTLVLTRQNKSIDTTLFEKVLATFADLTSMSRPEWLSLREILFRIRDDKDRVPEVFQALLKTLAALKDRMWKRILKPEEKRRIEALKTLVEAKAAASSATRAANHMAKVKGKDSDEAVSALQKAQLAKDQLARLQSKQSDAPLPVVNMRLTFFEPPGRVRRHLHVLTAVFDRELNECLTFGPGDYVQYVRDGIMRFGRVDSVLVLDNFQDRHIFVVLTLVQRTFTRHPLLDLEVMDKQEDHAILVGTTAIVPVCLYMVRVANVGTVWVAWKVPTL